MMLHWARDQPQEKNQHFAMHVSCKSAFPLLGACVFLAKTFLSVHLQMGVWVPLPELPEHH